jgi:glutathione S-transferase
MLRLYYSPGACSLASHLALEEAGAEFEAVRIDFGKAEQRSPAYLAINDKGRVPALADGDWVLTENPAILRFIAERFPRAGLWPAEPHAAGRCAEWLAWFASTVHVAYAHVRRAERYATTDDAKAEVVERGRETCDDLWQMIEVKLSHGGWAAGDALSVADLYALVFWNWGGGQVLGYDMPRRFPHWTAHARRLAERPPVRRVFEREGLARPA